MFYNVIISSFQIIVLRFFLCQHQECDMSSEDSKHHPSAVTWSIFQSFNIKNRTMKVQLQKPTCGKMLAHSKRQVSSFRESLGVALCVFKIGVTAQPVERFEDYMALNFTDMWIIFVNNDLSLIHMLEAALVSEFCTCTGCRNSPDSGGEGALNRKKHQGPPFYVYVTGGRADQLKRVG